MEAAMLMRYRFRFFSFCAFSLCLFGVLLASCQRDNYEYAFGNPTCIISDDTLELDEIAGNLEGSIYIAGERQRSMFTTLDSAIVPPRGLFLARINENGTMDWESEINGSGTVFVSDLAIDSESCAIVVCTVIGEVSYIVKNGYERAIGRSGALTSFIAKFDANGSLLWLSTWSTSANSLSDEPEYTGNISQAWTNVMIPKGVAIDERCDIYVLSSLNDSSDVDPGPGTVMYGEEGETRTILCILDENGNFIISKHWFTPNHISRPMDISVDSQGEIAIVELLTPADTSDMSHALEIDGNWCSIMHMAASDSHQEVWRDYWYTANGNLIVNAFFDFDSQDRILIAGEYSGTPEFSLNVHQYYPNESMIARGDTGQNWYGYLACITTQGEIEWENSWGGGRYHRIAAVEASRDAICVAGEYSTGADLDPTNAVFNPSVPTCREELLQGIGMFVSRFNMEGHFLEARTSLSCGHINDLTHCIDDKFFILASSVNESTVTLFNW